jgi:hypothetical protein
MPLARANSGSAARRNPFNSRFGNRFDHRRWRIAAYYESRKQKIHDKLSPQRHRSQARRDKVRTSFTRRNRQHRDNARIAPLPGGTYLISLKNGQEISSSRFQSRMLRDKLLKI